MASLEMRGPFELNVRTVDREVGRPGPGNFALGHLNQRGQFVVRRVGRSDENLKHTLKEWVGQYLRFKFSSALDAEVAYLKHCRTFHDFETKLDDTTHPEPPAGSTTPCPVCGAGAPA
jgi:hypothetical protein